MQLTRLEMVVDECTRDLKDEEVTNIEGFYFHRDSWWNVATKQQAASDVSVELSKCLKAKAPFAAKNSTVANFSLPEAQGVLRAHFSAKVDNKRLNAIQEIVRRGHRNASNAYAVKFNPMTGLLGKEAFHLFLEQRLNELASVGSKNKEAPADEPNPPALCVLALDIDRFKQVNDSHGHAYGDIVIKAFGMRIQRAAADFCKSAHSMQVTCAHVSGEEFFCVAWGASETDEFEGLADALLQAVAHDELPTEAELDLVSQNTPRHSTWPEAGDRAVTCSIGGVIVGVPASQDVQISVPHLLNQADLALYKSKNQGRNRITFFSTILQSGGRILQHREDVGICIIDIGSEVGVAKGQEFVVYHPDFAGKTPYVSDDGRSKKVLGLLPKVPLCKITAFDVQQAISFCRPSERKYMRVAVPANAPLEAIPLGTLDVAIPSGGMFTPADEVIQNVVGITETLQRTSGEVDKDSKVSFAVVGIRDESRLLVEQGPAIVNRSLAIACRYLQKISEIEFLGQVEPTKLLVQFKSYGREQEKELDHALEQAESANGSRAKLVAGVFAPGYGSTEGEPELPKFAALKDRVDLARYAATPDGVLEKHRVHEFTHWSAYHVLTRVRERREFERGLKDYANFTRLGIVDPTLDNQAGLLASASGNLSLAETFYLKAAEQSHATDVVYRLNAVNVQVRQKNYVAAVATASAIDVAALESKYPQSPNGIAFLAIAFAEGALAEEQFATVTQAVLWTKRALELPDVPENNQRRLKSLLEKLESKQLENAGT